MDYPFVTVTVPGTELLTSTNGGPNNGLDIDKAVFSNQKSLANKPLSQLTLDDFYKGQQDPSNPPKILTYNIDTVKHQPNTVQPEVTLNNKNFTEDYPAVMIGILAHADNDTSGNETLYAVEEADNDPLIMPKATDNEYSCTFAIPIGISISDNVNIETTDAGTVNNQDFADYQSQVASQFSNASASQSSADSQLSSLSTIRHNIDFIQSEFNNDNLVTKDDLNYQTDIISNGLDDKLKVLKSHESKSLDGINPNDLLEASPFSIENNNQDDHNDGIYIGKPNLDNATVAYGTENIPMNQNHNYELIQYSYLSDNTFTQVQRLYDLDNGDTFIRSHYWYDNNSPYDEKVGNWHYLNGSTMYNNESLAAKAKDEAGFASDYIADSESDIASGLQTAQKAYNKADRAKQLANQNNANIQTNTNNIQQLLDNPSLQIMDVSKITDFNNVPQTGLYIGNLSNMNAQNINALPLDFPSYKGEECALLELNSDTTHIQILYTPVTNLQARVNVKQRDSGWSENGWFEWNQL